VTRSQAITQATGGFGGTLQPGDSFGSDLAPLGDLNGDGTGDLAVGASDDDGGGLDHGAVWILFLKPDGTVLAQTRIAEGSGGFTGVLADHGRFGERLVNAGDLDGDGVPELGVLSGRPARLWLLFLRPDGTVKSQTASLFRDPPFPPGVGATFNGNLGFGGLAALGDLDGDGFGDLAIGAPYDLDGTGVDVGAVWIVRLAGNGGVSAVHKLSALEGGFTGVLDNSDLFGFSVVQLGDLDGDGNRELGVGAPGGLPDRTYWILYLDASERVRAQNAFGGDDYGAGETQPATSFARLGDLDGDGVDELALGFPRDPLRLPGGIGIGFPRAERKPEEARAHRPRARRLRRSGRGPVLRDPHRAARRPRRRRRAGARRQRAARGRLRHRVDPLPRPERAARRLGRESADALAGDRARLRHDVDVRARLQRHAGGFAVLQVFSRPAAGTFTPFGEVLVGGRRLFQLLAPSSGSTLLSAPMPPASAALIDLAVFSQGVCTGSPGPRLSNALDQVLGR
jgi:hypothetical protein